jgi:hypothetical protein
MKGLFAKTGSGQAIAREIVTKKGVAFLQEKLPAKLNEMLARYSELQKSEVTVEESGLCPQDLGPGINEVRQRCFANPFLHDIERRSLCQDRLGTNDVIHVARPRKKTTREVTSFIMICRAAGRTLVSRMGAQRIVRLGTGSPGCNDAVSCYSRCLLQVLACSSVYCSSIVRVYRLRWYCHRVSNALH